MQDKTSNKPAIECSPTKTQITPKFHTEALQAIVDSLANRDDASALAASLCALYVGELQRIFDLWANLDQARELDKTNNGYSHENSLRAAHFAIKDEEKLLNLLDRALRGLAACSGLGTRITFETIADMSHRKYHSTPEELRRQHTIDQFRITMLQKAILYKLEVPEEFLWEGSENELGAFVNDKLEQVK